MIPRLHLPQLPVEVSVGLRVAATSAQSHYLVRVLRLREGDPVQVFDGRGRRFAATLDSATRDACVLDIRDTGTCEPQPPLRITLAQCLATGDKMDWIIEKAVELGVWRIVALQAERCQLRLDAERGERKLEHWRRIVEAACMQCGQDRLPELIGPARLPDWVRTTQGQARPSSLLLLQPDAPRALSTIDVLGTGSITLLIGPESGFSDSEVRSALQSGFEPVRLGNRVLRTETAGLAAIAALQALAGEF